MKNILTISLIIITYVSSTQIIYAVSQEEESYEIKRVWTSFVNSLSSKDIERAIEYVIEERKDDYKNAFYIIRDKLPETFSKREEFQIKNIDGDIAQGENIVHENNGIYSYPVIFIKEKGHWRIQSF